MDLLTVFVTDNAAASSSGISTQSNSILKDNTADSGTGLGSLKLSSLAVLFGMLQQSLVSDAVVVVEASQRQ